MVVRSLGLTSGIVLLVLAGLGSPAVDASDQRVPVTALDANGRIAVEVGADEARMLHLVAEEEFQVAHMTTDGSMSPNGLEGRLFIALFPRGYIENNLGSCEFTWPHVTWVLLPGPDANLEPVANYPPPDTMPEGSWTYPPGEYTLLVASTENNLALIAFGDKKTALVDWWVGSGYPIVPTAPAAYDVQIETAANEPVVQDGSPFRVTMQDHTEVAGPGVLLTQHTVRPTFAAGVPGLRAEAHNRGCWWGDASSYPSVSTPLGGTEIHSRLGVFYPQGGTVTWGAVYSAEAGVWDEPTGSAFSTGGAVLISPVAA